MTTTAWPSERLKHVAEVAFSSVDKKSVQGEGSVRLCNYTDVYYNDEISPDLAFMEATASSDQVRHFGLRAGDVLLTKDSETADDIGVAAFVPQTLDSVVCGYHLALLRPKPGRVDPKYLFWSMCGRQMREQMTAVASGVTRYGLRFGDTANLRLFVPELARQRAVARFLDRETARIDALIERKVQVQRLLAERRRCLAAGLLEDIRRANGVAPLKRLISCLDGQRVPLSAEERAVRAGPYPYHGASEVVDWIDEYLFDETLVLLGEDGAQLADPLFPIARMVTGRLWVNNHAHVLRAVAVEPEYLVVVLNSFDRFPFISGATRPKITQEQMNAIPVPRASRLEQAEILRTLGRLTAAGDRVHKLVAMQLVLMGEHKRALITSAVTGELDLGAEAACA